MRWSKIICLPHHIVFLGRMVDVLLRPATVEGIEIAKDRVKGYDEEFVIGSNGDDDFAELAAILEIPVHFNHLVELECAIDDRLERATREAPGDVLHSDLPAFRVARHQPNAVSLDRWHLPNHPQ